ncbi:MAG: hypothetical protein WC529_01315 [Candidatus Margulisiibacteriota bacterium]
MSNIDNNEKQIYGHYQGYLNSLAKAKLPSKKLGLKSKAFTIGILLRMYYFYKAQEEYCDNINRNLKPAGSNYFEDAVASYLKAYLGNKYDVVIEEKMKQYRPDIIIKKAGKPIYILEAKTQLGRTRLTWGADFIKRKKELSKIFKLPGERIQMVVMSATNWDIQDKPNDVWVLTKGDPIAGTKIKEDIIGPDNIANHIEPLFEEISKAERR